MADEGEDSYEDSLSIASIDSSNLEAIMMSFA